MKNERIAMAATLVLAIIISLPNFLYPLFEDAALYSLIGHLMGDGLLPYRDLLDQKPPAIYWTTFLFDLLVGPSNIGLRAMELVTILLMGFACGLSAREISGKRWALPAGILLTTCLSSGLFWAVVERGQVEWYQATACAWAVYFAVLAMRTSRARHLALAGGMASLACWYKPQAAIFALGMASVLFLFFWRTSFRQALRSALWIAGAAVAASSPFVLWMLATGIFDDFVTVMFVDNAQYLQHSPIPTLGKALQRLFFWPWLDSEDRWLLRLLTGAGLAGFLLSSKTSDNHHRHFSGLLVLVWAGAALAQYLSGRYLFRYHSLIFIPIAALLLTLGMTTLVNLYRDLVANHLRPFIRTTVKFAVPLIVAITLLSNPKYGNEWASTRSWLWGSLTTEKIYHAYGKRLSYYEYRAQELRPRSSKREHGLAIAFNSLAEAVPSIFLSTDCLPLPIL